MLLFSAGDEYENGDGMEQEVVDERPTIPYTGFHQIVASEPNLQLQPTKSALKGRGEGEDTTSPVPKPRHSLLNNNVNSSVAVNATPTLSSVDSAAAPKPSPLATPQAPSILRNRIRPNLW